jgi:hypothetical protein
MTIKMYLDGGVFPYTPPMVLTILTLKPRRSNTIVEISYLVQEIE